MKICAIDIGVGGGFAWVERDLVGSTVKTEKMPKEIQGIHELVERIPCDIFLLEGVAIRPSDMDEKLFRKLKMIKNVNYLEAVIELSGKKHFTVVPQKWQAPFRNQLKGKEYTERKKVLKAIAEKIFKHNKVTNWSADALLILNFVFREYQGRTEWIRKQGDAIGVRFFD